MRSPFPPRQPFAVVVVVVAVTVIVVLAALSRGESATAASASPGSVTFTLFDNGSSKGGVDVTLSPSDFRESPDAPGESFAVDMSRRIRVSKYNATEPVVATKAFREDGEHVTEYRQLEPDSEEGENVRRRVYLVADGLEFVWPFVSLGHRQVVSPSVLRPASEDGGPVTIESMSETPRVFRVHNICSEDEARALIENALSLTGDKAIKRSTVGEDDVTETRTSENAWDSESDAAKVLITRSFNLTNIEETAGKRDGLQIVRYYPGQGYNTHPDYFEPSRGVAEDFDFNPYSGGSNRFATVFVYLNDLADEDGGFTVFPRAPSIVPKRNVPDEALNMFQPHTWQSRVTEKCYSSLAVPPKLGTAALFYSITPDGRVDPSSHHAACPLIRGVKWGANIWLWNRQRYGEIRTGDPRTLLISNEADEDVYITWERRDNGVVPPGRTVHMNTFEFHRFKAHFDGYKGKAFDEYTVESEPHEQSWAIRRPRVITIEDTTNDEL